jgi:hypothetical protein
MKDITTITVRPETKARLSFLVKYKKESFDQIINRVLDEIGAEKIDKLVKKGGCCT